MVHWNTFAPTGMALIAVVLLVGEAIVPPPLTSDQVPVAGATAALPTKVAVGEVLQALWSAPAFAAA